MDLWGYVERSGASTGIQDNIHARAMLINSDDTTTILISLDLGGISPEFARAVKAYVKRKTGVSKRNIVISCTHTHSAPAAMFLRNCGNIDAEYLNFVKSQILVAVLDACDRSAPVQIGYSSSQLDLSVNRREKGVRSDLGQDSGSVDPELGIVRFSFPDQSRDVLLVNYTAHPVTMRADNLSVSADYPGEIYRYVRQELGAEVLFLQGACADVNPKIFGTNAERRKLGQAIGKEIAARAAQIKVVPAEDFDFTSRKVFLKIETLPELKDLKNRLETLGQEENLADQVWKQAEFDWARDLVQFLENEGCVIPKKKMVKLDAIRIGKTILLFLPGEIFVATGLEIKRQGGDYKIMVSAYSNDCSIGYLPTRENLEEGGYEVNSAYKFYGLFRFGNDSEQVIRNSAKKIIDEILSNEYSP